MLECRQTSEEVNGIADQTFISSCKLADAPRFGQFSFRPPPGVRGLCKMASQHCSRTNAPNYTEVSFHFYLYFPMFISVKYKYFLQ